jgi:hypothetical protein
MRIGKLLSFAAVAALTSSSLSADTLADAFKEGSVSGELRAGYVSQKSDDNIKTQNMALGGNLGFETKAINGISAGVKFYTSQRLQGKDTNATTGLFDSNDESYSILGEAYVNVAYENTNLKAGRQKLDTPYANDDDIRMIPNLFEAYVLSNTDLPNTTLLGAYVTKWSGVDAGTPEEFVDLGSSVYSDPSANGTVMFAAIYSGIENSEISLWYYDVDRLTKITHFEASTEIAFNDDIALELGAQYAKFSESNNTGVDGTMYGLSAELSINDLSLFAAYNSSANDNGKSVTNGFGGGPFFTSMDETTIDGLNDAKAYIAGAEYAVLENLSISYAHGEFEDGLSVANGKTEIDEDDFVVEYSFNDELSAVLIYTDVDTNAGGVKDTAASFNRTQAYINYSF